MMSKYYLRYECPMCGEWATLKWINQTTGLVTGGYMTARCTNCEYRWKVEEKETNGN